jgi:hypothetical protein
MASVELECNEIMPHLAGNHLMLQNWLHQSVRCHPALIGSSEFERATRSSPRGDQLRTPKGDPCRLIGWYLPGGRAEPPAAHPPAPGMKHLIETDGFIPLSHDR